MRERTGALVLAPAPNRQGHLHDCTLRPAFADLWVCAFPSPEALRFLDSRQKGLLVPARPGFLWAASKPGRPIGSPRALSLRPAVTADITLVQRPVGNCFPLFSGFPVFPFYKMETPLSRKPGALFP